MSQHTPGPWKVIQSDTSDVPCIVAQERTGRYLALAIDPGHFEAPLLDVAGANARLIAKAPEMLEAIRAFVVSFSAIADAHAALDCDGMGEGTCDLDVVFDRIEKARALLREIEEEH